jgi:hypothetical protein
MLKLENSITIFLKKLIFSCKDSDICGIKDCEQDFKQNFKCFLDIKIFKICFRSIHNSNTIAHSKLES